MKCAYCNGPADDGFGRPSIIEAMCWTCWFECLNRPSRIRGLWCRVRGHHRPRTVETNYRQDDPNGWRVTQRRVRRCETCGAWDIVQFDPIYDMQVIASQVEPYLKA